MPGKDSLLLQKLSILEQKINSLSDSTLAIKNLMTLKQKEHSITITILEICGIVIGSLIIISIIAFPKKIIKTNDPQKKNFLLVTFCLVALGILFASFVSMGGISYEPFSHVDLFLTIASILGIIGGVWALLARIDAEKAFEKSKETLNALGTTFPFFEILGKEKLHGIIKDIGESGKDISLFLGFPYVGYLYNEKIKFSTFPDIVFSDFRNRLDTLKTNIEGQSIKNHKFKLSIFSEDDSLSLVDTYAAEKKIDAAEVTKVKEDITEFYKRVRLIDGKPNVSIDMKMEKNENLRFASIKNTENGKSFTENKSIIWIVKNLSTSKVSFDSSAFQSSDANLLSVVQTVF